MFPFVYGFTWDAGNIIFLGLFFSAVAVIVSTLAVATMRARRDFVLRKVESIRWESDFHDLPSTSRKCRHEFTGEFKQRTCDNAFECSECATHAKLLEHASLTAGATRQNENVQSKIYGFDMPQERLYHRGHTWVRPEVDGTATIGIDDFGARLVGLPDDVELPPVGSRIHVNGTAWHVKKNDTDVRILAPVDAEVVETGGPEKDWYLKVKPVGEKIETGHLLKGSEIHPWLMREVERLQISLAVDSVGATLADGGEPVKDFSKSYPGANWDSVLGEMFLEP